MTIPSYYSKKAARPSQSPAVTALPKGEPRVCAPLYRRIPRRREAVRPYNRLPSVRPVFSLSFRASDRCHLAYLSAPPSAGQIQIVATGHTAFTGGTRGRRTGTRSVRGPLAGRRAGRGHDRRPHGHPAARCADCRTPNRKAGYQQRARRRRHLPPQFNPCRRRREQGSVPRKRPRRRAPPSCGGDAGD